MVGATWNDKNKFKVTFDKAAQKLAINFLCDNCFSNFDNFSFQQNQDMFIKHRQDCEHLIDAQFDIYAITSNSFNKFQLNFAKHLIIM